MEKGTTRLPHEHNGKILHCHRDLKVFGTSSTPHHAFLMSCGAGPTPGANAPEMCDAPRHALIARGRTRTGHSPVARRKIGLVAILD